jgi:hypothetical protein
MKESEEECQLTPQDRKIKELEVILHVSITHVVGASSAINEDY